MDTWTFAWLAANGVAVVLVVMVLGGWARLQQGVRHRVLAGAVCVSLALALLFLLFEPSMVPTGSITVLMEGHSVRNVKQLYGQGAHFGSGFDTLIHLLTGHGTTTLYAVVHLNLCLALVNTIILFFIASCVLGSWVASLAFALGFACNLNTLHAAFSETPAMLWTTQFLLGCIAAAVIDDQANTTPRLRRLALLLLALLAILSALIRSELLLLGGPAVAMGMAKVFGWEPGVRRAGREIGRFALSVVAGRLSVFLLVLAVFFAVECLPWMGRISYVLDALAPLNPSFLLMPQKLGVFLPVGMIALFILGVAYAVRRWSSFLLLPITLLILFKMYAAASQGMFEGFRYLTFLTPVVMFLALFGFRELSYWAERQGWPPWWKRSAVLLLMLSMGAWQPLGPRELFGRRQELPGLASVAPLLAWNQQTEVRYLLDLITRYPECVFLAKTPQSESIGKGPTGYRWSVFGTAVVHYQEVLDNGGTLEQIARQVAPTASCVFFYRSLDCNLIDFDQCRAEIEGRVALEERTLPNLPYSDANSYGAHRAEIHLGVYPVVPQPRPEGSL